MKNILMNTEMTKAILDGRKVQTRRAIISIKDKHSGVTFTDIEIKNNTVFAEYADSLRTYKMKQPLEDFIKQEAKYQVGETIWVREPAMVTAYDLESPEEEEKYMVARYLADNKEDFVKIPSRFFDELDSTPKWIRNCQGIPNGCIREMARIFLKITDVRVERLQDIELNDIADEGFPEYYNKADFYNNDEREQFEDTMDNWWIKLWNKTAPKGYKWEDNPYVFVYEFERVQK